MASINVFDHCALEQKAETLCLLTLNRPGFLESSTAGGGRIPPPLCNFLI